MSVATIQAIASALMVVVMMLAAGFKLELGQLKAVTQHRSLLLKSIAVNLVAIPLAAWATVVLLDLPSAVGVGIVLVAAAPGGATAALYANQARSDLPQAVAMTLLLPAMGLLTTPATVAIAADLDVPTGPLALKIAAALLFTQLLPLAIGMLVRAKRPELAARLARPTTMLANLLLAGITVLLMVLKGRVLLEIKGLTWAAMLGLSTLALVLGYWAGSPGVASARSASIVAVTRNVAVAILLASTAFSDPVIDATVLSYALLVVLMPLAISLFWKNTASKQAPPT
ncbi:MAG: BASS family bile acid:Na+ symporter [Cognaticolwellia sp.]